MVEQLRRPFVALCLVALDAGCAFGDQLPRYFSGFFSPMVFCPGEEKVLLERRVAPDAAYAVLEHFWCTMCSDQTFRYDIDGEAQPPIIFTPHMACGQGYPNEQAKVGEGGRFSAGGKMGKAAQHGAWYHVHRIPFYQSIKVTVSMDPNKSDCNNQAFANVRGYEELDPLKQITMPSGAVLPHGVRMHLQRRSAEHHPLDYVQFVEVPTGCEARLYLITLTLESHHTEKNDYIEGCWRLYQTGREPFPGAVLGTGFEDLFDSAFWFGTAFDNYMKPNPKLYQHPHAGITAFARPGGREHLSVYRFFDTEHILLSSGGRLEWRVGDVKGKCSNTSLDIKRIIGPTFDVRVSSYTWVYIWPTGGGAPPPRGGASSAAQELVSQQLRAAAGATGFQADAFTTWMAPVGFVGAVVLGMRTCLKHTQRKLVSE